MDHSQTYLTLQAKIRALRTRTNPYLRAAEHADDAVTPDLDPDYQPKGTPPDGYRMALALRAAQAGELPKTGEPVIPFDELFKPHTMRTLSGADLGNAARLTPESVDSYACAMARRRDIANGLP